jgi:tRNA uridine 5-carboxymethylaminomethyl modification enzyme
MPIAASVRLVGKWVLIDDRRWQLFTTKVKQIEAEQERLQTTRIKEHDPNWQNDRPANWAGNQRIDHLADLLRRPGFSYADLTRYELANPEIDPIAAKAAEIEVKYSGYIQRQQKQIDDISRQSNRKLPADLDYAQIDTLSKEAREKLNQIKPLTIGQASRIGGVNPSDINALLVYLEISRRHSKQALSADSS